MFDKRINYIGTYVRVSRESHDASRPIHTRFGSMAQPFHSLCIKISDEHPTVATPKEQKFCAVTSQIHSGRAIDTTAQNKSQSTVGHKCARPSIDDHRRRPTSRNTLWASRCSQVLFPQFPVAFGLLTRTNNRGLHRIPCQLDMDQLNRGPGALLSVAQIMRCVIEIPQVTSRCGSQAILSFAFFRQPQLSQGKALPTVTPFGESPTFIGQASDRGARDSPSGEYCHRCDSFSLCQRSRTLKGLFRSL